MAVGGKVDEERVESIEVEEAPSTAVEFVVVEVLETVLASLPGHA